MVESTSLVEIRPGRRIYVDVQGGADDSSCPVVIMIHGSCAHSGQWDAQVNFLLQQHDDDTAPRIVRYDYFGCGQSRKPKENASKIYSASEHYADLLAVYERYCNTSLKVWVIGHSFGCVMALRLAAEKKDHVCKLVLTSPPGLDFGQILPRIFSLPVFLLGWMQPLLTSGFIASAFHPNTAKNFPELIKSERAISNANPPFMFKAFYQSMVKYYNTEAKEEAWSIWFQTVHVHVLVILGEDDKIITVEKSQQIVERLKSSQLKIVPNASHQVIQEQPDAVNEFLATYLLDR
mmetsp:Transcript_2928/g.4407  ORF Transcript_2928/g.4407 Transcript_2928/m.4407 type:complete len:292 (+) Transcript_2928:86-961(+)